MGLLYVQAMHSEFVIIIFAVRRRQLEGTTFPFTHIQRSIDHTLLLNSLHVSVLVVDDLLSRLAVGIAFEQLLYINNSNETHVIQRNELAAPLERLHDGQSIFFQTHDVQSRRDCFGAGQF